MPLTSTQLCDLASTLEREATRALSGLNSRLFSLRKLAGILELAGDLLTFPNPNNLLPVELIDASAYNQLLQYCPGLLRPYTGLPPLQDLRGAVQGAYSDYFDQLKNHPYQKLANLQGQLDNLVSQAASRVNNTTWPAVDKFACIAAICNAASRLPQVPGSLVDSLKGAVDASKTGVTQVLSPGQLQKLDEVRTLRERLKTLATP